MFLPERMIHVQAVFPNRDLDAVTEAVIRDGALQTVDPAQVEPWAADLGRPAASDEPEDMKRRRERVEDLLKTLAVEPRLEGLHAASGPDAELDARLDEVEALAAAVRSAKDERLKEIARLENLKAKLGGIPQLGFDLEGRDAYSYLTVETGRVQDRNLDMLRGRLSGTVHLLETLGSVKGRTTVLAIGLKRDRAALEEALAEAGFERIEIGQGEYALSSGEIRNLDADTRAACAGAQVHDDALWELGRKHGLFLRSVLFRVRRERLTRRLRQFFRKTDHTTLLAGWVPKSRRAGLADALRGASEGRCLLKETPADAMPDVRGGRLSVPVKLKNPWPFRPFEMLTTLYGTPTYRSLDPTPLVALSYAVMFGIMFGDLGHGFVLLLAGAALMARAKGQGARDAGRLLATIGTSSMVFGVLFGSVFGFEHAIPALWYHPILSIPRFLKTLMFWGVGMVSLSVTLSIINKVRRGDPLTAVFHRTGVLGLAVYWCGVLLVLKSMSGRAPAPGPDPLAVVLVVSLALLFFQEPIVRLLKGKKTPYHDPGAEGVMAGMMEGVVDLLETFLGFLTNTVSFIRVAAFGLAHAGLAMAVFALADAATQTGGTAARWAVIVAGNVGIIIMEGLGAGIQAIRLEFYEFFNRFFEHGDNPYRPVRSEFNA